MLDQSPSRRRAPALPRRQSVRGERVPGRRPRANSIPTAQSGNLHALWDGLPGRGFDEGDVERRRRAIADHDSFDLWGRRARRAFDSTATVDPLAENRAYGRRYVYTNACLGPVRAAIEGRAAELPRIRLSEDYLQQAGALARVRAGMSGHRLAKT